MDIIDIQTYKGRNIHSHKPVIKAVVDLGELYDTPTRSIDKFNQRLLEMLPGLGMHCCSLGYEGGFLDRLNEGTYLTHVTEHTILEFQKLFGYDVHYGKSRELEYPSVYYMVFEFINEKFATECLLAAVDMVNLLIKGVMPDIECILQHLAKTAAETDLGPSTEAVYKEAKKRGIPVTCYGTACILQLGDGKYTRFTEASLTDAPGCISVDIAGNKHLTKRILEEAGLPVPFGDIAYTARSAVSIASMIGYPVVLKPFDANQGKGVFLNINSESEVLIAFNIASRYSRAVIVEKHIPGRDFRLLVVGGKMSAAAERMPPIVTGDGIHTVKELVQIENANPLRGSDHEKPLTKIKLDDMSIQVLAKAGFSENCIPAKGCLVPLRYNGNLSTGGTARDCTDEVHAENVRMAVRAAELLRLDVAGIDITCDDISRPIKAGSGAIIEINAAPGLRMHLYPTQGQPRNVAGDILDHLFPKGQPCSIPIVSVTGTNGKTTVTRLIAHTLSIDGKITGMTNTSGIFIGNECILKGDNTGALSAARVLCDRHIDAAVLETARGGIIKKGLGYDLADVGVIVNISEDHLGIDGVQTLEELAMVKSLVAEAVKPQGFAVLNADDAMTPFIMKRVSSNILLFSRNFSNTLIQKQLSAGKTVVYAKDGSIYSADEGHEIQIAELKDIPITFDGQAVCNIENSLAAASALMALGMPAKKIRKGLSSFRPDQQNNPGRFNVIDMGDFSVMLDYGHNPAGLRAAVQVMKTFGASSYTGVIGMPGDRQDESITEYGILCAQAFSKLYIKEDRDLRGRNAGEVADILYNAAVGENLNPADITVIYSEDKAFETAIMNAQPGELVILFYEEYEPALEVLEKYRREINSGNVCEETAGMQLG